jgi:hypothetical protein
MRTTLSLIAVTLLLSACSTQTTSINEQNKNPITAARYGDELADAMANLIIMDNAIVKEEGMRERVQGYIEEGKALGDEARSLMQEGYQGNLIGVEFEMIGIALYLDDMLYLSSDFYTRPGPSVHVYLTTVVDPRDVEFPDATVIDLGQLQTAYGAHQYSVPHQDKPELYRTLVFYDTKLKIMYGFAQLSKQAS